MDDGGDNDTATATVLDPILPPTCPSSYCYDNVPLVPSHVLIALFKDLHTLETERAIKVKEVGSEDLVPLFPIEKQHITICARVKHERHRVAAEKRALHCGWPTTFNFRGLPDRIVAMDEIISQLVFDRKEMEKCFIWELFAQELGINTLEGSGSNDNVRILKRFVKNVGLQQKLSDEARPG